MKTGKIAALVLVSVLVLLLLEPVLAESNSEDPQDSRIRQVLISAGNTCINKYDCKWAETYDEKVTAIPGKASQAIFKETGEQEGAK